MKIAFIGCGNMAGAIIDAMLSGGRTSANDIIVFDKDNSKYERFSEKGVLCADSLKDAVENARYILIAVKPQDCEGVLCSIGNCCNLDNKIFISIAAGISTSFVCEKLGVKCGVVRVMPNTPLMLGCGATAISRNELVPDKEFTKICGIFASSGVVSVIPEDKMNAVISVNGSSPAYVFLLAKSMIDSAVGQGIDEKVARELTYGAILGSAKMLISSGKTADELITMVKSPKGTTEKALDVFERMNFGAIVDDAMKACTERANELGK